MYRENVQNGDNSHPSLPPQVFGADCFPSFPSEMKAGACLPTTCASSLGNEERQSSAQEFLSSLLPPALLGLAVDQLEVQISVVMALQFYRNLPGTP